MIDQVIDTGSRPEWTVVGDVTDDGDEPVAVHDDGAELFVDEPARGDPASYIASLVVPVEASGVIAEVVVATESFHEQRELLGFVAELCDTYSNEALDLEAVAIVPHNGSIGTVNLDIVRDGDATQIASSQLADVFCVDTSNVPDDVDLDDIESNYPALVNYVYGLDADVDESDIVDSITESDEAYGEISLDVYTVTNEEMKLHETESEQPAE